jgi:hypothetical protein
VFAIGTTKKSVISLPRGDGIKKSLIEERDSRLARQVEDEDEDEEDDE